MALKTSDQEFETIERKLSLRGTTLEKASGAKKAESEAKSTLECFSFLLLSLPTFPLYIFGFGPLFLHLADLNG